MTTTSTEPHSTPQQLDVLIIGAGLSGIGMSYQLKKQRPDDTFVVIESREHIGGTWDLFKYPGIRSDSDMYTFAYSFKPWKDKEFIGTGERINHYLQELVDENDLRKHIRFQQRVSTAKWDSTKARWTATIMEKDGSEYQIEAKFMVTCTGYYNYEKGYVPNFKGYDEFTGIIAHPQHWPQNLDYHGKRVIVIGSGATAVTIVPSMANEAAKVTMLQRSPTYIVSVPSQDWFYTLLSKFLPPLPTNRIMRAKYILLQQLIYVVSRRFPQFVRKLIRSHNNKALAGTVDVDRHFNPQYKPWDQRMCMVPNEDLFASLKSGKADIVTDQIECFTAKGIRLASGKEIEADIIVPATGLDVQFWGGMALEVDGQKVDGGKLTNYKGMMFSQVPNLVTTFGYTNAPWTLKAELTHNYVCRLLNHMQENHHQVVYPHLNDGGKQFDLVELKSGYVMRAGDRIPKQGASFPWRNKDLYFKDLFAIKHSALNDHVLRFDDTQQLAQFHQKVTAK